MAHINAIEEQSVNVDHVRDEKIREELHDLLSTYKPEKNKDTKIEMRIVVKTEQPVSQRPRGLPLLEGK